MIFTVDEYDLFLQRPCLEVDPTSEDTAWVAEELLKAVEGIGIGLAANQIGELKQIAVMNLDHLESRDPDVISRRENMIVTVMPSLIFGVEVGTAPLLPVEGCLSIPGKTFVVPRFAIATLSYFDLQGNLHQKKLRGFAAVVAQHEVGHLKGELICHTGKEAHPEPTQPSEKETA